MPLTTLSNLVAPSYSSTAISGYYASRLSVARGKFGAQVLPLKPWCCHWQQRLFPLETSHAIDVISVRLPRVPAKMYECFYGVTSPPKFYLRFRCRFHILCLLSAIRHYSFTMWHRTCNIRVSRCDSCHFMLGSTCLVQHAWLFMLDSFFNFRHAWMSAWMIDPL